jgi:predicted small lipoprotein YifL
MMLRPSALPIVAVAIAASLALSGCGKKGPLEAPNAAVPTAEEGKKSETSPVLSPVPKQGAETKPQAEAPQKPFLLDFLL